MSIFYRNIILGIAWMLLLGVVMLSHTTQMFLSMLFTVFVLHMSENLSEKIIGVKTKFKKFLSIIISIVILSVIGFALYHSVLSMWGDLNEMLHKSQPIIIEKLHSYGVQNNITTISDLYSMVLDFIKLNVGFLTFSAGLVIKVIIGILLGIVVHFSQIVPKVLHENAWDSILYKLLEQSTVIYNSFRDIMGIQIIISLMNTTIISIMALGLTYVIYGQVLPYWYVIIPLTAILSLIPVVGNIMINVILILATVQISPTYVLVGVGLFLVIHKLELIVIGKKMKEKVDVPFVLILFSMLLGELLFHSMSGMLLGMVLMVSISKILKSIPLVNNDIIDKKISLPLS